MELRFAGEVWWWRGPAPYHFVTVPPAEVDELREQAAALTYGWGMLPATVTLGATTWTTALWPKDDAYVVPLRAAVRHAEGVELGDVVELVLTLDVGSGPRV